jgi:HD-GYP domain-containing protein (c-di-GMP phosphodiesterase class II)
MRTKLLVLLLFLPLVLMGQDLTQRYIDNANRQFILGDFEKAYSSINFVLRSSATTGDPLSVETIVIAEKVYFSYLSDAVTSGDELVIGDIAQNLQNYPRVNSLRITNLQETYQAQKAEEARLAELARQKELEAQREAELQAIRQREREEYERREREIREAQAAAGSQNQELYQQQLLQIQQLEAQREAQRAEERMRYEERQAELAREQLEMERRQREEFNNLMAMTLENQQASDEESNFQNLLIIVIVSILGVVVVLGFFGIVFLMMKHSQQQQQSFDYTVNSIRTLRSDQMLAAPAMEGAGGPMMLEDNSSLRALPPGSGSPDGGSDLKDKVKLLIETCKSYGAQIDEVTGRKNATKNVSKLVHSISKSFGYNNSQAMLHYMAGLIYDIGFLNIDPEIFQKDTLSNEEFVLVQEHPKIGTNMIHFIDKNLQPVFLDAIKYHHENLDGTGYPYGISGDEIPFIARVIRVVESYVALVSSRVYKNITDKESAIEELMKNDAHYDLSIIQALNDLV